MEKKKIFNIIAAGLFLVGIVLWFALPAVQPKNGVATYTFLDMTFGKTTTLLGVELVIFKFSFLNLLTVILMLGAFAVAVLRFLGKGIMKSRAFIVFALAVLALVFVILSKQFVVMTNQDVKDAFIKDYTLTGGAIAIAVLAGLGGVSAVLGDYIK